jgi:hypothetical protein
LTATSLLPTPWSHSTLRPYPLCVRPPMLSWSQWWHWNPHCRRHHLPSSFSLLLSFSPLSSCWGLHPPLHRPQQQC